MRATSMKLGLENKLILQNDYIDILDYIAHIVLIMFLLTQIGMYGTHCLEMI